MKFGNLAKFVLTVLLMGATVAMAVFDPVNDDTDIFLANPTIAAERPNVLIVVDNSANWNQPFANEKAALVQVVNGLTDQYNVGLMIMSDSNIKRTGDPDASDGSYVRSHVRRMTLTNKSALATIINNFSISGDKGDNNLAGLAMYEAYLYFAGKPARAGDDQSKADHDDRLEVSTLVGHALPGVTPAPSPLTNATFPLKDGLYRSPIQDGCARNFIIYISNGPSNENAQARAELEGKLKDLTGTAPNPPAVISITPSGQQSNWADEMAKFMANADVFATSGGVPNSSGAQNIYTYTVEIDPASGANIITVKTGTAHGLAVNNSITISGTVNFNGTYTVNTVNSTTEFTILNTITPNPPVEATGTVTRTLPSAVTATITEITQTSSDMTALLKSMAANGKGKYFGVTSGASGTAIVDALNAIFTEVQAVNSVFASTTLPVSVNVRGTNLNQVYIGVFRPDPNKAPRWLGNLKMYNLAFNSVTNTVFLADAANGPPPAVGNQAENTSTGFVSQTSPSFWTHTSSFWGWRPADLNGPGGASDYPDGDLVEKGGAAQQVRDAYPLSQTTRNLYTCTTGDVSGVLQTCATNSLLALTPFTTQNDAISAAALQLDTRLVSPLTGFDTKPVTALTDRRQATLNNANPATEVSVQSMTNTATTRTIVNLTTATPKVIPAPPSLPAVPSPPGQGGIISDVQGAQTINISSVVKSGNTCTITSSTTPFPSEFAAGKSVSFANIAPSSTLNGTTKVIDAGSMTATTFTVPCTGTAAGTSGTASISATVSSTTATVTLGSHGFAAGDSVTISGASPPQYNGTFNITSVPDANHFTYTMLSAPTATGYATGTITATANTRTATATTSVTHGFSAGNTLIITGSSDNDGNGTGDYDGSRQIVSVLDAVTFTFCVGGSVPTVIPNGICTGGSVVPPDTNSQATPSTVFAIKDSTPTATTITVTTTTAHGFLDGDSVVISGSNIAGYNGTWTIACPGGCIPVPPVPPALPAAPTVFTFVVPTVLPANTSTSVKAALAGATISTVTASVTNHGFLVGEQVVIESTSTPADANHPGTYPVTSVVDANIFKYSSGTVKPGPTGSFTARRPTSSLRGIATVTAHGYAANQEVTIRGATPSAYNTIEVVSPGVSVTRLLKVERVVDADTFEYSWAPALGTAPGPSSGSGVTSSIKTTTARATAVNHGFPNNTAVTIAGATPGAFNGVKTITVVDANTFTYPLGTAQGDAFGTVTAAQATGVSPERDLIIQWVRGQDNFQDENSNSTTTDIRASVHGDVLHSRPAVINYNRVSGSDDDVFIFYGGNDGVFHSVKGGYTQPTYTGLPVGDFSASLSPGREAWGFVPEEFFSQFKRMRNNAPIISSSFKKPYFMDGPISVYTSDANNNNKLGDVDGVTGNNIDTVNLYVTNRRGGRFIYALDVNVPTKPRFLWKISNFTEDPSGVFPFAELGQTWSQPTVVTGLAGLSTPVLVFGAGYDAAPEDVDPKSIYSIDGDGHVCLNAACTGASKIPRSMGRGIYVVNALTGKLIWSAGRTGSGATKIVSGMDFAIPSDVTVIRNETTGVTNRAYVGDTGGNLWRIDFKQDTSAPALAANPNNLGLTTVTKLASIADMTTKVTVTDPDTLSPISVIPGLRKFLFPPDVVGQTGYDAVLIGSGDREHPFDTTVVNRFYMFKDKGNDSGPLTGTTCAEPTITESGTIPDPGNTCAPNPGDIVAPPMSDLTSNCIQDAAACTAAGQDQDTVTTQLGTNRGWFITLLAGEKAVGNAISISNTTFFNTNQPSSTAGGGTCGSNLGVARQYQVSTVDATATSDLNAVGGLTGADRSVIHAGGGYLPSPVHVVVMLEGKPVEAVISGIQVSTPAGASLSARLRKFWYKEVDFR